MLSVREDRVYSNLRQNILELPYFKVLSTQDPQLRGKYYVTRKTLFYLDTDKRDLQWLEELCDILMWSGKLMSDGEAPWIGELSYIVPLTWLSNRMFVFVEICSYVF
jgi:hypothetical protein